MSLIGWVCLSLYTDTPKRCKSTAPNNKIKKKQQSTQNQFLWHTLKVADIYIDCIYGLDDHTHINTIYLSE